MERFIKANDVKELLVGLDSLPWEEEVDDIINQLPVTDVQEVKHGSWRLETDEEMYDPMFKLVVCSECNETANDTYRFCPNCGSKMNVEYEKNY